MERGWWRLTAVALAVVPVAITGLAMTAPSIAAEQAKSYTVDAQAEADFMGRINDLRASKGLPALAVDSELTAIGRSWAQAMAEAGSISHNPNFPEQVKADWQKLGENVGSGADVASIHDAFVRSGSHYRNLVEPGFTLIGVGVVRDSEGVIFTAHQFMQLRSAPPPASPPAVQPSGEGTAAASSGSAQSATPSGRLGAAPSPALPASPFAALPEYWPGPGAPASDRLSAPRPATFRSEGPRTPASDPAETRENVDRAVLVAAAATVALLGCAGLLFGRRRQGSLRPRTRAIGSVIIARDVVSLDDLRMGARVPARTSSRALSS